MRYPTFSPFILLITYSLEDSAALQLRAHNHHVVSILPCINYFFSCPKPPPSTSPFSNDGLNGILTFAVDECLYISSVSDSYFLWFQLVLPRSVIRSLTYCLQLCENNVFTSSYVLRRERVLVGISYTQTMHNTLSHIAVASYD